MKKTKLGKGQRQSCENELLKKQPAQMRLKEYEKRQKMVKNMDCGSKMLKEIGNGNATTNNTAALSQACNDDEKKMGWAEIVETPDATTSAACSSNQLNTSQILQSSDYIAFDTNIVLHHIKLLNELKNYNIMYLPYAVIRELDWQKQTVDKHIRFKARKAMNFLLEEMKSGKIQAQSALQEKDHKIDIYCNDDSIINSVLQLKCNVLKAILITNDKNMLLKAKANDIEAYSNVGFRDKFTFSLI